MSWTLVIIDMQDGFHSAKNPYTIKNIQKEIRKAIKHKVGIIVVEYEGFGRTLWKLRSLLDTYEDVVYVSKYTDDGGREVYDEIISNRFNRRKLKICGVNSDACVCETALTLANDLPYTKVEVVEDACNSSNVESDNFYWVEDYPNIILIEGRI